MHIHSGCDWAVTLDSMQEDYPVLCAFAQIARRLDCRRPRMCVRWLRKREGDGVRLNRPKGLMTPDRRAALRSFFWRSGPQRMERRCALHYRLCLERLEPWRVMACRDSSSTAL